MDIALYIYNLNRTVGFLRILLVWIGLSFLTLKARGQQTREVFCPTGPTITLDTITFTPNQPLPFDRCFYLVVTLPATTTVDRFAITPVDKQGRNDLRKRDLNIFARSVFQKKSERDKFKEDLFIKKTLWTSIENLFKKKSNRKSYSILRRNPFFQLIKITEKVIKGNKVDFYLHITPLDPGREYNITLIGNDDEAFDDVIKISSTIIDSKLEADATKSKDLMNEASRLNVRSIAKANKRNSVDFQRGSISKLEGRISRFKLNFDLNEGKNPIEYRLFFVPLGGSLSDINQAKLNKNNFAIKPTLLPQTVHITWPQKDINGTVIDPFQIGKYTLAIAAFYTDPNKEILKNLGELALVKDANGFHYEFTPDPKEDITAFIELDDGNPLAQFSTIRSATATIAGLPTSLQTACSDTATLRFLLTQASLCPCEEKGIKDLTQKDDLMRTISLLYDNNSAIIKNSLLGLTSLKTPAATPADADDYQARSANLSASISQLNDLIEFARKEETYHNSKAAAIGAMLTCLQSLQDNLSTAKKQLGKIIKAQDNLQKEFTDGFGLLTTQSITKGSTSVLNLVSETKFRIIPDFGFVALFKGDKLYTFQNFTPYLGFQVGFRPIDKDIPFRMVHNKSLWHRLSFMSGITLTSIKIENQREDFFASNSLITGLGFRINNWLRATSGVVWFKAVDPNRLSANKPVRFSPFLGLSIDFELQDLFGGIAKLFK